ncbi:MAG: phosphoribosylanthranilate isomerase [Myxococcales bacterium]|nr:phosphoribosylanthranilate isomerase [Myxococcales bacterium]MCB9754367.1 phosphoribosylanthranilate isomerase [Myxococcales bacterium]
MAVRLKICGVCTAVDYALCTRLGVDSIGLNLWPGSKRFLADADAAALPPASRDVERVGVFVDAAPEHIIARARALSLDLIQPHGDRPAFAYARLGIPYTWVIRGTPELDALEAAPAQRPTRILLDAAVDGFGGAGRRTDWAWARRARDRLSAIAPVWLAGGLNPENAAEAIATVGPAGIDVATGAERDGARRGEKDPARVSALLELCRRA